MNARPPMRYSVDLADLIVMADCACELDGMRMFYVDRPDEQARIAAMVSKLHSIVESAAGQHADLIYGADEPE